MKRNLLNKMFIAIALIMATFGATWAQDKDIKISPFEAGKVINKDDIMFLSIINEVKSRGEGNEVMMGNTKIAVGQTLNETDSKIVKERISVYNKSHKATKTKKERGGCFYRWYCNAFGYCVWYLIC